MAQNGCEIERTGWEIVPYVPKDVVPHVEDPNSYPEPKFELFHAKINKILNAALKHSRDRARIVNATRPRRGSAAEAMPVPTLMVDSSQPGRTVGRRKTSTVVESVDFSVAVPPEFPAVNVDNLRVPKAIRLKRNGRTYDRRFSFGQRLVGWNFERRLRPTKKIHLDSYYLHYESKVILRSFVEIVNFILYEEHPKMFKRTPKAKVAKPETQRKRKNSGESSGRKTKKSKPTFEVTVQEAEEFLSGFENFGKDIGSSSKGKEVETKETAMDSGETVPDQVTPISSEKEVETKETDVDSEETIPDQVTPIRPLNANDKGKAVVVEMDDDITSPPPKNDAEKPDIVMVDEAGPSNPSNSMVEDTVFDIDNIFNHLTDIYPFYDHDNPSF